jgi:hypothetical protein
MHALEEEVSTLWQRMQEEIQEIAEALAREQARRVRSGSSSML